MANITIKELKEKLSEYSDDMVINESCLDKIHSVINIEALMNKACHVHCDFYIPMSEIVSGLEEEFASCVENSTSMEEAFNNWMQNYEYLIDDVMDHIEYELADLPKDNN